MPNVTDANRPVSYHIFVILQNTEDEKKIQEASRGVRVREREKTSPKKKKGLRIKVASNFCQQQLWKLGTLKAKEKYLLISEGKLVENSLSRSTISEIE